MPSHISQIAAFGALSYVHEGQLFGGGEGIIPCASAVSAMDIGDVGGGREVPVRKASDSGDSSSCTDSEIPLVDGVISSADLFTSGARDERSSLVPENPSSISSSSSSSPISIPSSLR